MTDNYTNNHVKYIRKHLKEMSSIFCVTNATLEKDTYFDPVLRKQVDNLKLVLNFSNGETIKHTIFFKDVE